MAVFYERYERPLEGSRAQQRPPRINLTTTRGSAELSDAWLSDNPSFELNSENSVECMGDGPFANATLSESSSCM